MSGSSGMIGMGGAGASGGVSASSGMGGVSASSGMSGMAGAGASSAMAGANGADGRVAKATGIPPLAPGVPDQATLPPVTAMAVASMVLVLVGGVYLASYLPRRAPVGPAVVLVAVAGAVLVANVAALARVRRFPWGTFRTVGGWALAAYLVISGMLEYVFVLDGTRGAMLGLMTAMLAVFAVDVPLLLGFSVARFQPAGAGSGSGGGSGDRGGSGARDGTGHTGHAGAAPAVATGHEPTG